MSSLSLSLPLQPLSLLSLRSSGGTTPALTATAAAAAAAVLRVTENLESLETCEQVCSIPSSAIQNRASRYPRSYSQSIAPVSFGGRAIHESGTYRDGRIDAELAYRGLMVTVGRPCAKCEVFACVKYPVDGGAR